MTYTEICARLAKIIEALTEIPGGHDGELDTCLDHAYDYLDQARDRAQDKAEE